MAARQKRDPAYFREWRRKKKERELAGQFAKPLEFAASGAPDIEEGIAWIEAKLKVPNGPLTGKPFRLPDWQKEWVRAAYGPGVREAGLSISRKNGKSGLIAAVLLAHLCGPLARRDWRAVVGSLTGPLARELRDAIETTALASGLRERIGLFKSPPPGRLTGLYGSRVDFLAADRASGHALGADLAIIDEAGLLPEAKRALWNALFSSISGRDGRFWAISIQADGPMFEEMGQREGAKGVHWRKWTSDIHCELDDRDAWLASNPGIADGIKSMNYMEHQAERAAASPGNEAHFRAYDLNQPVDPEKESIVAVSEYARCIDPDAPGLEGDLVVGVDLGSTVSMTAAAALSLDNGALLVRGAFGDEPPLSHRARADRMGTLYDRMQREGELRLYPGKVTPVAPFLHDFFDEIGELGRVTAVGADRHRKAEAIMAFRDAGIPHLPVQWRGQGAAATADGSHDVRAFQRLVRTEALKTRGSTMLEAAIASSVLRFDGAGNPALNKAANNARIDALSAAVIAAGLGEIVTPAPLLKVSVI
ncbi:MAG: hypothetical protein F4Z31_05945 [Gemmatimonadetes bacterium]|nr:hypothetical protein [Gemmatimonadota bacterium]